MRALGVDLGSRRVGLAVSDSAGTVATPLQVVDRRGGDDATWRAVADVAAEWEVAVIVVGLPRSLDGSEGPAAAAARADAAAIAAVTALPVEFADERLSTVSAAGALRATGMLAKAQRARIDAAAAAVFLQGWLDARRAGAR